MNVNAQTRAAERIRREIDAGSIPGGAFGLWQHGRPVLRVTEGMADVAGGIALEEDSLYRVYSMSKPITAVAAMMLVEEGRLRFDAPVSEYLPEYANLTWRAPSGETLPSKNVMTVGHLMSMTSGLVYPDPDPTGSYMQRCFDTFQEDALTGGGPTTRELARMIAAQPLDFEPGTNWRYGLSADVMGAIIEVIAGQSFGSFLRERLFDPLGMEDTGFYVPKAKQDRLITLYTLQDGVPRPDARRHLGLSLCLTPPPFESGGAGIVTTVDDYAKFGNMLAARGIANGRRFLSEDTIRLFEAGMFGYRDFPGLDGENMMGCRYGCLMRVIRDPAAFRSPGTPGEFGWEGWTGPYMSVNAVRGSFMVFMMQVGGMNDWALFRDLRAIAFSALE